MNEEYLKRMQGYLREEYPGYLAALQEQPYRAFRINTLKIDRESFFALTKMEQKPVPFYSNGYYYLEDASVAKDPFYKAALYYMQEPSAMSAVGILDVRPGMKVLDLCAAPGSKSTQIAECLNDDGLLVSNEIHTTRAFTLLENIEKQGSSNTIVLNSDPKALAESFPEYFDRVLVDAPCSGEGMFRKEKQAVELWGSENVHACALRQRLILESAYTCLKPGGLLVYSTCTFSKEENEETIEAFLTKHSDMEIEDSGSFAHNGFQTSYDTQKGHRIYPMDGGEGHFCVRLKKLGENSCPKEIRFMKSDPIPKAVTAFFDEYHIQPFPYTFVKKDTVYGGIHPFISVGSCHLLRHQVKLGTVKKDRFEPDHALVMNNYVHAFEKVDLNREEIESYTKGNTITKKAKKGYVAVCYHGYAIGLAKSDGTVLKNKYPKNLRVR